MAAATFRRYRRTWSRPTAWTLTLLSRAMLPRFPTVAGFHSIANAKLFVHEKQSQAVADFILRFLSDSPRNVWVETLTRRPLS